MDGKLRFVGGYMWKDVKNFESLYQVSDDGQVRSVKRIKRNNAGYQEVNERIRKLTPDKDGYLRVCLSKDGLHYLKAVHRLVAEAFVPNPENLPVINHIDENKQNNCADNLEWCTVQYNTCYGSGTEKTARAQGRPVIQFEDGIPIHEYYSTGKASRETGIPQANIYNACAGKRQTAGGCEWRFKDEYKN